MRRKLRLSSETLRVLSRSQARQVAGGISIECSQGECATDNDCSGGPGAPCEDPTNDYTWAQCDGTCGATGCQFTVNWGETCPNTVCGCTR